MKTHLRNILTCVLCLAFAPAYAQFGPPRGGTQGPSFSGPMAKLLGENSNFSANMELQTKIGSSGDTMTMPGAIAVSDGNSRFEIDMTQAKSARMPPQQAAQMKSLGMDKMVIISRPDKKLTYMVYPGLQAYVETPVQDPDAGKSASDFKIETTELGRETIDGHPCVKNKSVVTDNQGNKHEATLWNATDLKKFPVKIEQTEQGNLGTMLFKDIKLSKPDASLFEPPAGFTKYDNMMTMMQQQMMKRAGGNQILRPPPPPQQP